MEEGDYTEPDFPNHCLDLSSHRYFQNLEDEDAYSRYTLPLHKITNYFQKNIVYLNLTLNYFNFLAYNIEPDKTVVSENGFLNPFVQYS